MPELHMRINMEIKTNYTAKITLCPSAAPKNLVLKELNLIIRDWKKPR